MIMHFPFDIINTLQTLFIFYLRKLDEVGPLITDPPPTSSTTLSIFFYVKKIYLYIYIY